MINRHMRTHNRNNESLKALHSTNHNGSSLIINNNNTVFSLKEEILNDKAYIKTES